jgi:F-type H+-transporting ATPase subunit delta
VRAREFIDELAALHRGRGIVRSPPQILIVVLQGRIESLAQTLIDLGGSELDAKAQNFVLVLAANKRLALLPDIATLFEELKADYEKTVDVEVISAFGMDSSAESSLVAALKKRLQRDVKLNVTVDRALIGGMIVRAGDLVIDGSVRGRLNKLAESIN